MVPFTGKAGLVPLDYGTRDENSVLFYSSEWDDLLDLLTYPQRFIANVRGAFRQVPPPDWTLGSPMTIILVPGSVPSTTALTAFLLLQGGAGFTTESVLDMSLGAFANAVEKLYTSKHVAYLAEFAIETRVLTIVYGPPPTGAGYFTGQFLPATLNRIGTAYGYLHFDVDGGPTPTPELAAYSRACVAMDFIEDRQRILNRLVSGSGIMDRSTQIANAGSVMSRSDTATPISVGDTLRGSSLLPTVVMESVLPDPTAPNPGAYYTCVCGQAAVLITAQDEGSSTFTVCDLLLKGYTCP